MVCTSLGSLVRPLFYFLCYIHFSLSVRTWPRRRPRPLPRSREAVNFAAEAISVSCGAPKINISSEVMFTSEHTFQARRRGGGREAERGETPRRDTGVLLRGNAAASIHHCGFLTCILSIYVHKMSPPLRHNLPPTPE